MKRRGRDEEKETGLLGRLEWPFHKEVEEGSFKRRELREEEKSMKERAKCLVTDRHGCQER